MIGSTVSTSQLTVNTLMNQFWATLKFEYYFKQEVFFVTFLALASDIIF